MCLEDVRVGRLIRHRYTNWVAGGPSGTVIAGSQQRVAISVSALMGGPGDINAGAVLSFNSGPILVFSAIHQPSILTVAQYGDIVMDGFTVTGQSGDETGTIIEMFLTESALEESLEWLNRNRYK